MERKPTRTRSPWLRLLGFGVAIALFIGSYGLGHRQATSRPTPSLALLVQPPIPLADFRLNDTAGGTVNRETLTGYWTLMVLASQEEAVRPWLQQLAGIYNHLASEPQLQSRLLLAATLPPSPSAPPDPTQSLPTPWRLLRGTAQELTHLRRALRLTPAAPDNPSDSDATELLLVIDPQGRLYGSYRLNQAPAAVAHDLVLLVERYSTETQGDPPRGH